MGRGLVEPTDDLRATNPATHPALLDELADDFIDHGHGLRHTIRVIALSNAYARSSLAMSENKSDDQFYSHTLTTPLEPEVLADAIADVTGVFEDFSGHLPGTRSVSLFDPKVDSETLDILGRCRREDSCESNDEGAGGLTLKLHLLNGPLLNRRIVASKGRLSQLVRAGVMPEEIVDQFYRIALCRSPSKNERLFWREQFVSSNEQKEVLEDFLWSLLTCKEFVTNH